MAGYTRQSSYSDGDTITAAHTNDEFNQLEAAFNADTGHDHSGAGEGGPIASLASHGITFGARTAGTDITVTWAGEDNDGVLKWMEDEDYFEFSDDILIASTEKLQFGDTATFLQQSSDGVLRIDGEATIDLNASTAVTVSNDLKLDSDSAVLGYGSDNDVTLTHVADTALLLNSTRQLQFGDSGTYIHQSADGVLDLVSDTEIEINATTVDLNGNLDVSGTFTLASTALSSTAAELNLLDGSSAGTIVNSKALIYGSSGEVNATTLQIAGTSINSTAAELNLMDGGTSAGTTAVAGTDGIVTNDGGTMRQTTVDTFDTYLAQTTKTLTNKTLTTPVIAEIDSGADITLDATADIILDAGGANIIFKDDGTSILDIANNSSDVELTVSVADKNFAIKGTDGSSAITALDIDMELAGKATFNGDVVVGGDLTVTGDDITMGTNTAGNLLVADGTNFNSVTVGSLSEISTVANDDVFLAVDTSDSNALKKITRSAIVSGLASSGAISNVVEDTSPQLGANLDTNSHNILIDDAHFIADENGNEQIIFQTTTSAVNQFDITNAATGNPPLLSATGGDTNIDLDLSAKGTGHVTVRGGTNSGAIQFNCEDNSHGQIVIAQPHSASVTNTLTLPAGSSSTLVSLVSTDTLTNKTLTSPVLNTATVGTSIVPSSADGATLGTASVEFSDLFLADGGTVQFGNDQDVTLTHVADTGLLLNSTMQLQFNDASQFINAPSATVLDINATDEIELNATLVDVNANLDVSGTYTGGGLMTTGGNIVIQDEGNIGSASDTDAIAIASDGQVSLTQDLTVKTTDGAILKLQTSHTTVADGDVLGAIEFSAPDDSAGTDAITVAASIVAEANDTFAADANEADLVFKLGNSGVATEMMRLTESLESANRTELILTHDQAGNLYGPVLTFNRVSSSPANDDKGGQLLWKFENDANETLEWSYIRYVFTNVSDGSEAGKWEFVSRVNGSNADALILTGNSATFGGNLVIADAGNIGSASDTDAIAIASNGVVTLSQGLTSTAASNTLGTTSFNDANITNVGDIALDSITSDGGNAAAITFSQGVVPNTVTEAASGNYTPDMSRYTNFILTVDNSNNCTLQDPTDEVAGQSGIFVFIQDGTGGGTLSHADDRYFVAGGTSITLSTAANAIDIVPYFVQADGKIHLGVAQKAFAEA